MDFETALERFKEGNRSLDVLEVILQDVYGFLESENYHAGLEVVEILTNIEYK